MKGRGIGDQKKSKIQSLDLRHSFFCATRFEGMIEVKGSVLVFKRFATNLGGSHSKNGRDSIGKRLGIKVWEGKNGPPV